LAERKDMDEAKKLASELFDKMGPDVSPALLQNFGEIVIDIDPSLAKRAYQLCLDHPEVGLETKYEIQKKLEAIKDKLSATPDRTTAG
jgi:hypothetical protein